MDHHTRFVTDDNPGEPVAPDIPPERNDLGDDLASGPTDPGPASGGPTPATRPPTDDEVDELLELAFAAGGYWHLVPDRFHSLARANGLDIEHESTWPARYALGFFLEDERSPRERVELRSRDLGNGRRHPPHPREASPDLRARWAGIADAARHPAVRARFLDLLVQAGGPGTPDRAVATMRAYLDHATLGSVTIPTDKGNTDVDWRDHDIDQAVGRALSIAHIAQSSPDSAIEISRGVETALDRVKAAMAWPTPVPGRTMRLLGVLLGVRRYLTDDQEQRLLAAADSSFAVYGEQDHVIDELAELVVALAPARRDEVNRLRVQCRLDIAEQREPQVASHFLELAVRLATNLGLREMADEATRRLQRLSKEDHGLQSISVSSSLPGEAVDAHVRELSAGRDWRESLSNWIASSPPSGDYEHNLDLAERLLAGSLRALFSTVRLGADNLPRWHATTPEDKLEDELARTESFAMGLAAHTHAEALDRIKVLHGKPPIDELTRFLALDGRGDLELARALAKSLHRYWDEDYEGCLHTAVPRVEAAARALVLLLDSPAYSVARTNNPGKYIGLDALLDVLVTHGLDPSWDRFVRTLLLGPVGGNLRHDIAHGFGSSDPSRPTAALALRALALFVVLLWKPAAPLRAPASRPVRPPVLTVVDALLATRRFIGTSPRRARQVIEDELAATFRAIRRLLASRKTR